MKFPSWSLSACVIVTVSCLVWTSAITMALVHFLKLTASGGWMIAGFLAFIATLAVTFILYGMKHAAILADHHVDPLPPTHSDRSANVPNSRAGAPRAK